MLRRSVLENYWLRVETALWRARDIEVIRGSGFRMEGKCLDLGGGDGTFSFLLNGGRINPSYDSYSYVDYTPGFNDGKDIYDFTTPLIDDYVVKPADTNFIYNLDQKFNLLQKASNLAFYSDLRQGDANSPLDFADNTFDSVFSNIIYWLENPSSVFSELSRVAKPGATFCFVVPNHHFPNTSNLSKYSEYSFNKQFLQILDRGRHSSNIKCARHPDIWVSHVEEACWSVIYHDSYLSDDLVSFWDVGLRPFSPYIIKGFNRLPADDRLAIKIEWVDGIFPIYDGFLDAQLELESKTSNFEIFICQNKK